jgi:endonuclease/exonuclease/phosphatase family metal-dependent hydrolase
MRATIVLIAFFLCSSVWAGWSVLTYNIRNFGKVPSEGTNLTELTKIIKEMKSDVMAFEEVVDVTAFKSFIRKALPGYATRISSCGGFGQQHLAIVYDLKAFKFIEEAEDLDFSGGGETCGSLRPVFMVTLEEISSTEQYTFVAIHLKAGGDRSAMAKRWVQYKKLTTLAQNNKDYNMIFLGDFNTTGYLSQDQDFIKFEAFLKGASLQTMSRDLGCSSYWDGGGNSENQQPSLLDHIVLQEAMVSSVYEVKLGAHCAKQECRSATKEELGVSFQSVSDHCPIRVSFK